MPSTSGYSFTSRSTASYAKARVVAVFKNRSDLKRKRPAAAFKAFYVFGTDGHVLRASENGRLAAGNKQRQHFRRHFSFAKAVAPNRENSFAVGYVGDDCGRENSVFESESISSRCLGCWSPVKMIMPLTLSLRNLSKPFYIPKSGRLPFFRQNIFHIER